MLVKRNAEYRDVRSKLQNLVDVSFSAFARSKCTYDRVSRPSDSRKASELTSCDTMVKSACLKPKSPSCICLSRRPPTIPAVW